MGINLLRLGHKVGWYKPSVEGPIRLGVTRNWFGHGKVVGVWGGGISVEAESAQLVLLQKANPSHPEHDPAKISPAKRILAGIKDGRVTFEHTPLSEVRRVVVALVAVPALASEASPALAVIVKAERTAKAAAPAPAIIPTYAELDADNFPIDALLIVRAHGNVEGADTPKAKAKAKATAMTKIAIRIRSKQVTLEQLVEFSRNPNQDIASGAQKALFDLELDAHIVNEHVRVRSNALVLIEILAPKTIVERPAVEFLREMLARETVTQTKELITRIIEVTYRSTVKEPVAAAAEPVAAPAPVEAAPVSAKELPPVIPETAVEPVAVVGVTPVDTRPALQVEIDQLAADFVRLNAAIKGFGDELTVITNKRDKELTPEFKKKSANLANQELRLSKLKESTSGRAVSYLGGLGSLESQLRLEKDKLANPAGAVTIEFTPEETAERASFDRLLAVYADKIDPATVALKSAVEERKAAIEEAAKKRAIDKLTASTREEVSRLEREIGELKAKALDAELSALAEREEIPVLEGTTIPTLSARILFLDLEIEKVRERVVALTASLETNRAERETVVTRAREIDVQALLWHAQLAPIVAAAKPAEPTPTT